MIYSKALLFYLLVGRGEMKVGASLRGFFSAGFELAREGSRVVLGVLSFLFPKNPKRRKKKVEKRRGQQEEERVR